jgi:hypothetical protein
MRFGLVHRSFNDAQRNGVYSDAVLGIFHRQ